MGSWVSALPQAALSHVTAEQQKPSENLKHQNSKINVLTLNILSSLGINADIINRSHA